MDRSITVSIKGVLLAVLVVLALLVAYLIGSSGTRTADAAEPVEEGPTIEMVGVGDATAVPDEVAFSVSVGVTRDNLDDAMKESNTRIRKVLGVLTRQGVAKPDVQTSGLSMNPQYEYPNNAPRVLTGYRVTQKVSVVARELTKAGGIITEVVEKGGNGVRVSGIRLQVGDLTEATSEARKAAVEEATAKAEQYAEATGQELGRVIRVREGTEVTPVEGALDNRYQVGQLRDMDAAAFNMPIRAGETTGKVRVRILWSLSGS